MCRTVSYNRLSGFVTLHPDFKVPPDKMGFLKAILPEFPEDARRDGQLFHEFTINGDEVFCREALRERGRTARAPRKMWARCSQRR